MLLDILLHAIPVLEEVDKSYIGKFNTQDPIAQSQTNLFMSMGLENPELMQAGFKQYTQVMGNFENGMIDIVSKFQAGNISWTKAVQDFKLLSGENYKKLFTAGARAVGNEFYDKLALNRKDVSFLNKARRTEMRFFKGFLNDIKDPKHMPSSKIPRDPTTGKKLPGYRVQKFDYLDRSKFYSASGKAQFFNGMVAGAGSEMDIFWRLGVPQTEHCDVCPQYARVRWTWQTIPTVPRSGDTPCLWRCYCYLEFKPKTGKMRGGDPDKWISRGIQAGQLPPTDTTLTPAGRILDPNTRLPAIDVSESLVTVHDGLRAGLNKARQMLELPLSKLSMKEWIKTRIHLNDELILLQEQFPQYRFLPKFAVKDLVSTVKSAAKIGGKLTPINKLLAADEVVFVRGISSDVGRVQVVNGEMVLVRPSGEIVRLDDSSDLAFLLKRTVVEPSFSVSGTGEKLYFHDHVSSAELDIIRGWSNTNYSSIRAYLSGRMPIETIERFKKQGFDVVAESERFKALFNKYKNGIRDQSIYRGLGNLSKENMKKFSKLKPGDTFDIDTAPSSWTSSRDQALYFTSNDNVLIEFLPGRVKSQELDIWKYSEFPSEKEVILAQMKVRVESATIVQGRLVIKIKEV